MYAGASGRFTIVNARITIVFGMVDIGRDRKNLSQLLVNPIAESRSQPSRARIAVMPANGIAETIYEESLKIMLPSGNSADFSAAELMPEQLRMPFSYVQSKAFLTSTKSESSETFAGYAA